MRSKKSHPLPWFTAALALFLLAGCASEKVEVMKSPCAGLEGSPCGPKRPVNAWWLHTSGDQV